MADHDDDDEEVPNSQDLQDEDDADVRRQLREAELSPHEQRRSLDEKRFFSYQKKLQQMRHSRERPQTEGPK